ncbi:uncharacterized protein LOC143378595 [Andrena cerasifolii]|uniref:uncharacterized protein LOC143378595 n=1 Tax=Andrena cerasifolii TaxID=2819439 RepID=UPI0040383DF2
MGEVCSVFQATESWAQQLKAPDSPSKVRVPETRIEIDTNDTNFDHETWRQAFLVDAPVLRGLLFGASTESNLFDAVCTINRLIFFYVIIERINLEVLTVTGGGLFAMNR